MKRRHLSLPPDVYNEIGRLAEALGYGEHGRVKFLRVVVEVADEMPSLFRKRR